MTDRRASFCVELGWCGFGAALGLVPELRLGFVRVWCCRGSAADMLRELPKIRDALKAARDELRRRQ